MAGADTRITTAAENPLCTRLKTKFDGRGMSRAGDRADVQTGTFTRVKKESPAAAKAESIATPFEETARFERATVKKAVKAEENTVRFAKVDKKDDPRAAQRRVAAYETATPFASGAYSAAYARAAQIRARAYDGSEARASAEREAKRRANAKRPPLFSFAGIKNVILGKDEDEIEVKKSPVSASLIIGIVIFAVVVMMIIFSFAQISEFKKEISVLDNQKAELVEQIDQLALEIDLKNDIRVIEQIATEEYGMVKSNRVESKYISVAEGERIVLPESDGEETADYGVFTTLMSAASSNWDKIMEYID